MKIGDLVFLLFAMGLVYVLSGCAPPEDTTVNNNDCVIYTETKVKCKHERCEPLPTAEPSPVPEATPAPETENLLGCTIVDGSK